MIPADLRGGRPTDFAVEASTAALDHLQDVQFSSEKRLDGGYYFKHGCGGQFL